MYGLGQLDRRRNSNSFCDMELKIRTWVWQWPPEIALGKAAIAPDQRVGAQVSGRKFRETFYLLGNDSWFSYGGSIPSLRLFSVKEFNDVVYDSALLNSIKRLEVCFMAKKKKSVAM